MISKKTYSGDGITTRFLSDFIIRSEQFTRPYVFIYDNTLNPDGTEDKLVDGTTDQVNWSWPDNIWKRGVDIAQSNDLVSVDKWQVVDNSVAYYIAPIVSTTVWIEVATTSEEFGETLTQPSVERAETAASEAVVSAAAALASETAAAVSASTINLPDISTGNEYEILEVNSTKTGYNLKENIGRISVADRAELLAKVGTRVGEVILQRDIALLYTWKNTNGANNGGTDIDVGTGSWVAEYNEIINVKWFGAINDGITNNFTVFQNIADVIPNGTKLIFPEGDYLIEYTGGYDISAINGITAFPLIGKRDIEIVGQGATIKIVDHDITANSGLLVFSYDGCQNLDIHGFTFDLSFIGRNDSATYYPFCGAIKGSDTGGIAGSRVGVELSSNISVYNNTFKVYHPLGCYAQALNPFPGDPNNGFKIYSLTALGDRLATDAINQNFNITFKDNTFTKEHNAYGVWIWAYSNFTASNNNALSWANYTTDSTEVDSGGSIPMIRYHQFYNTGILVSDNIMICRPLAERTLGYQGRAIFAHVTTNLAEELEHGSSIVKYNQITQSTNDTGILIGVYGVAEVYGNIFKGLSISDRPRPAIDLLTFENGKGFYNIRGNSTNELFAGNFIRVDSSAAVAANRRIKSLEITDNNVQNTYGLGIFFISNSSLATTGVENTLISNNTINAKDSEYGVINTNGAGIDGTLLTESSDLMYIRDNKISYFYNSEKVSVVTVESEGNITDNITAATNYNYLPISRQTRSSKIVATGVIPRVGASNADWYSHSSRRTDLTTGVVLQVSGGSVAGGTSIAAATPAGEQWEIDEILIGHKG